MIGHVSKTNFASKNLLDLFKMFFILRPVCIVFYTSYTTLLAVHRAKFTLNKLIAAKRIEIEKDEQLEAEKPTEGRRGPSEMELDKSNLDFVHALVYEDFDVDLKKKAGRNPDEEIEFEHPEIPSNYESFMTFLMLPVLIYGGFGRSVVVSEKRSNILLFSHS